MDKLRAMAVFQAIAAEGSLTAAAKKIGRSLPAVVRALAALEDDLGVRLFNRSTRRIALTEEGVRYLAFCERVAGEIETMESGLRGDRSAPEGLVHVTAPLYFGELHVAPAVRDLMRRHAGLRIRLALADRVVDLVDEHLDIAVRIGRLEDSSLIARKVGEVRQVLCAAPSLITRDGMIAVPRDLAGRPCLQINGNDAGATWTFRGPDGKPVAVPVSGRLICNTMRPAVEACVAGLGFGLFLSYQVQDAVRRGALLELLRDFEPEPLPVSLVYPHARLLSTRVRVVLDALEDAVRARLAAI